MKKNQNIFFKLLFTCSLALVISCKSDNLDKITKIDQKELPGIEKAKNIVLTYSDSALVRIKLAAPTLLNDKNKQKPKRIFPDGVVVDFYDNQQKQTGKLIAKYAEQYPNKKQVILRQNVNLWTNNEEHIQSDELIWEEQSDRIYSTKAVTITTPKQTIHGKGFQSSLDFSDLTIDSVSGIIQSDNLIETPF
jgi:LPS export ABC transporter protein LptC